MAACAKLSVMSELSRSSSLSASRTGSTVQSPLLPFQHGVVLVQRQLGRSLSHTVTLLGSNVKNQPPYFEISFVYGGESQFWLGSSPISDGIPKHAFSNSLFYLYVFFFKGLDSFLSSVERFEVFQVSFLWQYLRLKVLCSESSNFLSHNDLSVFS